MDLNTLEINERILVLTEQRNEAQNGIVFYRGKLAMAEAKIKENEAQRRLEEEKAFNIEQERVAKEILENITPKIKTEPEGILNG